MGISLWKVERRESLREWESKEQGGGEETHTEGETSDKSETREESPSKGKKAKGRK
jgi:hypothetical protein